MPRLSDVFQRLRPEVPDDARLVVDQVEAGYGQVKVLKGVSLEVGPGERVGIIGANGAGKTTLLRTISGLIRATAGAITFGEVGLDRLPAHKIVRAGVIQVPEGRQVFAAQTVVENLQLGARTRHDRDEVTADFEYVLEMLPALRERRKTRAGALSGGQQQMLAIARAVMSAPKLLMIDEMSLGLAPILADEIAEMVSQLAKTRGMRLLVVEQNVAIALALTERTYVMRNGSIVGNYASSELVGNRDLVLQYLGS